MTSIVAVFIIAFAPGLFWLWLVYTRARCQPEPLPLLVKTFLFGIGISVPVAAVELLIAPARGGRESILSLQMAAYVSFVVAGLTEEAGKFLVVRSMVYGSSHFDEPIDGIVYSAAAALGFASIENVGYVLQFGIPVMLARAPISTLSHAVFSSFWGYGLAMKKVGRWKGWSGVVLALVAAIVTHGAFNLALFQGKTLVFVSLFAGGIAVYLFLIRRARRASPQCKIYPFRRP